ncbi:MAG TPA: hypothetical protein DCR44_04255 [Acholeplasmatales bacterium]|nr:hypothetical protein [Acholeplasmatales bacterium]
MELFAIPICLGMIAILLTTVFLYRRSYERRVNEVLQTNVRRMLLTPTAVFSLVLALLTAVTAVFQLVPRYTFETTSIDPDSVPTINDSTLPFNQPSYRYYDMKRYGDHTIVAYTNQQFHCLGEFNTVCNWSYDSSRSQISYFDSDMNEVWTIGTTEETDRTILFDQHRFDARAIDRLADGSFVAFGRAADLDTEIFYEALLMIDSAGTMVEIRYVELQNYDYWTRGTGAYDIVGTADGGFTIKYADAYFGSVIIHYGSSFEEVWHVRLDDGQGGDGYVGYSQSDDLETLRFANQTYIVLVLGVLYSYSEDGLLLWRQTVGFNVTGFAIVQDQIILTGQETLRLKGSESIAFMGDVAVGVRVIRLEARNIADGSVAFCTDYQYVRVVYANASVNLISKQIFADESGNLYVVAAGSPYQSQSYVLWILKFSSTGVFLGDDFVDGNYLTQENRDHASYTNNKADVAIEGDQIVFYTPNLSLHRSISMSDLALENEMPLPFKFGTYELVIRLRVAFVQALLAVYGLLIAYMIVDRYRQDGLQEKINREREPYDE